MNLYEILGVRRNATGEEIKRAYRKKAQRAHPDKGGDANTFSNLNHAYSILSNPGMRSSYDQTGDDANPRDENAAMLNDLAALILGIIEGSPDPEHLDVMATAKGMVNKANETYRAQARGHRTSAAKLERALKRFHKRSGGDDVVSQIFAARVAECRRNATNVDAIIDRNDRLMALLADYVYDVDRGGDGLVDFVRLAKASQARLNEPVNPYEVRP